MLSTSQLPHLQSERMAALPEQGLIAWSFLIAPNWPGQTNLASELMTPIELRADLASC